MIKIFRIIILINIMVIIFIIYNSNDLNSTKPLSLIKSSSKINIFCFILTYPANFDTQVSKSYENCMKYCTDYR